jgi:hypothetical protein
LAATPLAATFPVAETPTTFHFPPVAETPITSNLSSVFPMLKHHRSTFFISFHPVIFFFSHLHHCRNNSVQQLFRLFFVAETPFVSNPSSAFPMLKHHRSALFDFLPRLKHQLSASSSSTAILRFFFVAETPAFHHHPSASFYAPKR